MPGAAAPTDTPPEEAVPAEAAADAAAPDDAALARSARALGALLVKRGLRLAAAESCTGGWIGKILTDVAGSSDWFEASLVTYSNAAKAQFLGVAESLLAEHGAVSEPVVRAMAEGAQERTGADVAVAVSGIAGPSGGSAEKPVGLVWFAWAHPEAISSERRVFPGDREAVRRRAVAFALERTIETLEK